MAIRKSARSTEYTAMPQDTTNISTTNTAPPTSLTTNNGGSHGGTHIKNGGHSVVVQTYMDNQLHKKPEMLDNAERDNADEMCGWGPFKPGFCQRFRDPKWVLFWMCWAGAIQVSACCYHCKS